jgi:hypothetical protein
VDSPSGHIACLGSLILHIFPYPRACSFLCIAYLIFVVLLFLYLISVLHMHCITFVCFYFQCSFFLKKKKIRLPFSFLSRAL